MAFRRSRLQCFGVAWHLGEAACSVSEEAFAIVSEGSGTFGGVLAVFWRGWHF